MDVWGWWRSACSGEAAALTADEASAVARTVADATELPYVLGLFRTRSGRGRGAGAAAAGRGGAATGGVDGADPRSRS